jgi:hypothetical protein
MTVSAASSLPTNPVLGLLQTRATLGKPDVGASDGLGAPAPTSNAREEFEKFATMSPAERMRASILQQLGVTEDQLAAMSSTERKAMEDKITAKVKEMVEETAKKSGATGLLADIRV